MSQKVSTYGRKRAQTMAPQKKKRGLTKIERHTLMVQSIKQMGYEMNAFHLRWMPGEYLDAETLDSVPMFWFKKFGWARKDIEKLYVNGEIELTKKRQREMTNVFGKNGGKRKNKSTKQKIPKSAQNAENFVHAMGPILAKKQDEINGDDIYLRTRRLLKKVDKMPSKVRLIDNQSTVNVSNAGFPDMSFVSDTNTTSNTAACAADATAFVEDAPPSQSDNSDDSAAENPNATTLAGVSETEESDDAADQQPRISIKLGQHLRRQNSMSTPFGDMDTNTMISLRAKHRRTSSLMQRMAAEFSMKQYVELAWSKLAVQSGRGDCLTQTQFDIELERCSILADPDVGQSIFKYIQTATPTHRKQIQKDEFLRISTALDEIPLLAELTTDLMAANEHRKVAIVVKQVVVHIAQAESFNVNAYLTVKLSASDLNNVDLLLQHLSSREYDWTTRLRVLEWVTANLETSAALRALTSDENIGPFLLGWMCQCLDERSNLAMNALEMFPNVLSIAMTHNGTAFQLLDDIFSSLFLVLRNKRSKDLNQNADECSIQCVDMIMDWHEHGELDHEVLWEICHILRDNTSQKEQKHDKVRERCVAYFGYLLYGTHGVVGGAGDESQYTQDTHMHHGHAQEASTAAMLLVPDVEPDNNSHGVSKSADFRTVEDSKEDGASAWKPSVISSLVGHQEALKISKIMKRKYLLDHTECAQFSQYLNDAIQNGLNDKSGEVRDTTFKLLQKLERDEQLGMLQIDPLNMSKFNKWKDRKNRGNNKKKSMRKRIKKPMASNQTQHRPRVESVTLTIDAQ